MFCREDGTPLDRWQVRREFAAITKAAGLGEEWAPRELRHSFVSILSAHGVRIEDISDLMGHSGTTVTETVYRHEIRPALTTGATAMDKILAKDRTPGSHRASPSLPGCHQPSPRRHSLAPKGQRRPSRGPGDVPSQHASHEHMALRWLPDWLPKIEKGPERNPEPLLTWTFWSGRPDLNRRPLDPQSSALPNCATSRPPMRTLRP